MKGKKKKTFMEKFRSFYKGEFLLNIHADEYFVHIIWVFFLAMFMIWAGYKIDNSLTVMERNRAVLEDLEIQYTQRKSELVKLDRISTIQKNLSDLGSDLQLPERPATVIKKKGK